MYLQMWKCFGCYSSFYSERAEGERTKDIDSLLLFCFLLYLLRWQFPCNTNSRCSSVNLRSYIEATAMYSPWLRERNCQYDGCVRLYWWRRPHDIDLNSACSESIFSMAVVRSTWRNSKWLTMEDFGLYTFNIHVLKILLCMDSYLAPQIDSI